MTLGEEAYLYRQAGASWIDVGIILYGKAHAIQLLRYRGHKAKMIAKKFARIHKREWPVTWPVKP